MTKRLHTLFLGLFEKVYYKVWQNRESFTNFKIIIIKCEKVWQVLQSKTEFNTTCDNKLLCVSGITKADNYYKVRRNTSKRTLRDYFLHYWNIKIVACKIRNCRTGVGVNKHCTPYINSHCCMILCQILLKLVF